MQKIFKLLDAFVKLVDVILLDQQSAVYHNDIRPTKTTSVRMDINAALQMRCMDRHEGTNQSSAAHYTESLNQHF